MGMPAATVVSPTRRCSSPARPIALHAADPPEKLMVSTVTICELRRGVLMADDIDIR